MTEAIAYVSFAEFLEGEVLGEVRHELVGGRVYAMAGGTERHDLTAGLIFHALTPGALRAGCRPFNGNRILHTPSGSAYYPDVMVVCGRAPDRRHETGASLIVEVLSPSTANVDRREKAIAYAAIPALRQLLLVHPDERRIEVAQPAKGSGHVLAWESYGPGQVVFTGYGNIAVDDLYDTIDRTATTT